MKELYVRRSVEPLSWGRIPDFLESLLIERDGNGPLLPQLSALKLHHCPETSLSAVLSRLANAAQLTSLHPPTQSLRSQPAVGVLSGLPWLSSLHLTTSHGAPRMAAVELASSLSRLTGLTQLRWDGMNFNTLRPKELQLPPKLRELELPRHKVSARLVQQLTSLTRGYP